MKNFLKHYAQELHRVGAFSFTSCIGRKPYTGGREVYWAKRERSAAAKLALLGIVEAPQLHSGKDSGGGYTVNYHTRQYRLKDTPEAKEALAKLLASL